MERRTNHNVSRRDFLAGALATAAGLPLLNACAPAAPSGPAPAGGAPAGGAAKTLFPTYVPIQNGPKADFHDTNPLYTSLVPMRMPSRLRVESERPSITALPREVILIQSPWRQTPGYMSK